MIHILSLIIILALTPVTIKIADIFYNERIRSKKKEEEAD